MKVISIVFCMCLFSVTAAFADAASTGAGIFKRACLNELAIVLRSGSSLEEGMAAAGETSLQFTKVASQVQRAGLVGSPRYKFPADRSEGSYFCHVSSKGLTVDEITPHFRSLSRRASRAFGEPEYGKAAAGGSPGAQAEGLKSTFRSQGLVVVLKAIYFVSGKGPVGGFMISIEHEAE